MSLDLRDLSRTTSHALRHEPWLYGLELDDNGWVAVDELVAALRSNRREWEHVSGDDIEEMVATSPKNRYEISGGRIRARYGHSTRTRIELPRAEPPAVLFHGTDPSVVPQILRDGLTGRARQYVHLSATVDMAAEVGRRKARVPAILTVDAAGAFAAGIVFRRGNEHVWLADRVPPNFIRD